MSSVLRARALLGLLAIACGSQTTLEVATYNMGLAYNYVPYAESRQQPLMEALGALDDVDLICLQEVWMPDDVDAVQASTSSVLSSAYIQVTEDDTVSDEPACTDEEIDPLVECGNEYCSDTEDLVGCVLGSCGSEFDALSDVCKDCAAANVGLGDINAIAESCLSGNATYAYGGHNGLALLSKQTLESTEMLELDSWLNKRVLLYAKVGDLHVGCTHLTSRLSVTDYGGDLGSYKDEQSAQIDAIMDFMKGKAGDEPSLLLGDFNTGPELDDISAELPGNWGQIDGAGWSDPNVEQADPFCTWCASNVLTGGSSNELIDHVLLKGAEGTDPRRIFDEPQAIVTSDGTLELPLSDHYGVQATVTY